MDHSLAYPNDLIDQYLMSTDTEGVLTYCNDSFKRLYQLVGISVAGIPIESIFNHKEANIFRQAMAKCKQNKLHVETIALKKPGLNSGDEKMHYTLSAVIDKKGQVIGTILKAAISTVPASVKRDASPQAAQSSNHHAFLNAFEATANAIPEMMWLTSAQHLMLRVNEAWLNFTGISIGETEHEGWLKLVHPEDHDKVVAERHDSFLVQQPYALVFRYKKFDGSFRWLQMKGNPIYDELGAFQGYAGVALDITPVKEAQIQIKRQQELMESTKIEFGKFTKIAQKIGSIIIMCNADNRITWVNDAFVKTSGYSLKEVSGRTPGSFLKGPETNKETLNRIRKVIELGKGIRTEILYYTKSGKAIWLDIMIETLFDKDGLITGYITIQKDITLKKISEKEVLEQMNHLKKISFITSHELRHEFSKILQLLQTAKFQDHNVATYAQIFADIEYSANLMNDAIFKLNDQINFASSNSISLNKYLLNQAIEEICLVDDDHLVNKLNELIIRNVMPSMPVQTFDHIDIALQYVKDNPNTKRKIFLDLNFAGRSGWDFLHEYEKLSQPWPIVILTSSIDHVDYERSKKFANVTHFITKPLTIEQFEKLSEMEHAMVH